MKSKFYLLSLLALATFGWLGACSSSDDDPAPRPQQEPPFLSLRTSAQNCAAEGGEFELIFYVADAFANTQAKAEATADWVTILSNDQTFTKDDADPNKGGIEGRITYRVAPNTAKESRTAKIKLSYAGATPTESHNLYIAQEGVTEPEPQPEPENPLTLDISVAQGDETGANTTTMLTFTCKSPQAARFDFCCILTKDVENLLKEGKTEEDIIGLYLIQLDAEYVGQMREEAGFPLQIGPLKDNTEYTLLAKVTGFDEQTLIKRCDGKTAEDATGGENLDAPFTIEVAEEQVPGGFVMTLKPDELAMQYVCHFVLKGTIEHLGRDEQIINAYLGMGDAIYNYVFSGPVETTAEQFTGQNALIPDTEYYVIAFGFDGYNATTPLFKKLVKTGAGPSEEGMSLDIKLFDVTDTSVSVTIDTNKELVPYVFEIVSKNWYDLTLPDFANEYEMLREYAAANIFEFNIVNFNATPANVIESCGGWYSGCTTTFYDMDPGMEVLVFAMSCDPQGNLGKVYKVSEPFQTLPEGGVAPATQAPRPQIFAPRAERNYRKLMHR